jgi:protein-S-isoprenylcysteine O-methyltransferase Ste14
MLRSFYAAPLVVLWVAWFAYWMIVARNVKVTRRREGFGTFLLNRVFVVIGALLLVVPRQPLHWLDARLIPPTIAAYWLGFVIVAAGLGFAVWARVHLGRNWSATVTVKQDHELIRTGPYGVVRHPIYTGILLAVLGTALAIGEWRGLIAFVLFTVGFVIKLKAEERFMNETFGEQYARYRAEVPTLIPFVI